MERESENSLMINAKNLFILNFIMTQVGGSFYLRLNIVVRMTEVGEVPRRLTRSSLREGDDEKEVWW